jgi:nucleoid-associated protein YgaU
MEKHNAAKLALFSVAFLLSGCVVRAYQINRERIDQETDGNRGYLTGQAPTGQETAPKKTTRTVNTIEIELYSPFKSSKKEKTDQPIKKAGPKQELLFIEEEQTVIKTKQPQVANQTIAEEVTTPETTERTGPIPAKSAATLEKYTVQKGDTLEKISQKVYGTGAQWYRIYQANKDTLSGPDRIYVGQVLDIPTLEEK